MSTKKVITVNKISLEQYHKLRDSGYDVKVAKEPPRKKSSIASGIKMKVHKLRANGYMDYRDRMRKRIMERTRARKLSKKIKSSS